MVAERWCPLALLAAALPSCIASNVVAVEDRAVVQASETLDWSADPTAELAGGGLFESVRIEGDAAAQLRKIYYLLEAGGRYTAAALMAGDDGVSVFQTLTGTWNLRDRALILDDAEPVALRGAVGGFVQLQTPAGSVVLRRVEFE